jgi:hypothetical protein
VTAKIVVMEAAELPRESVERAGRSYLRDRPQEETWVIVSTYGGAGSRYCLIMVDGPDRDVNETIGQALLDDLMRNQILEQASPTIH